MRRVVPLPVALLLAAGTQALRPLPRPALAAPAQAAPRAVGVAGCSAAACHNANGPPGSKGSEYSTWATLDPHARAYRTLFNERSRNMQLLLDPKVKAHENERCLKCHAMERTAPGVKELRGDGVGCEA